MENKYSNKYVIETGMGLQNVDNIKNSSYFINETEKYINGDISLLDLEKIIWDAVRQVLLLSHVIMVKNLI